VRSPGHDAGADDQVTLVAWLSARTLPLTVSGPRAAAALVRRLALAIALAAIIAGPVQLAFRNVGVLLRPELFFEDLLRALWTPPEARQDPNIVIVAIRDSTMSAFPYSSPIDRGFLSELMIWLAAQSPRAIGLDVLFDQPTEPAKDEVLRRTLANLQVPLVVSYVDDPESETTERLAYLDAFVPRGARALANLGEDRFDTARTILPARAGRDGQAIETFPRLLARKLGVALPDGPIEISWRGSPDADGDPFRTYPAQSVRHLNPKFFRDKVVLIGSDFSLIDRHRTPFAAFYEGPRGQLPGIVIQAHATAQLLQGRGPDTLSYGANFAIALGFALVGLIIGRFELNFLSLAVVDLFIVATYFAVAIVLFRYERVLVGLLPAGVSLIIASWAMESLGGQAARTQREFIRSAFAQYVPPTVVKQLLLTPERLSLRGERRTLTLIFTDVADFTVMSEGLGAEKLGLLLNRYFDGMCQVVFEHQGTILKFIGDAIFAVFNAPIDQPDHAERAVRCALALDKFAEDFRRSEGLQGILFGATRIGIHTGEAEVGNFGSLSRKEYGAMGDSVNIAARLEGLNKFFQTRLCISGATVDRCSDIDFRPLADVILKGKSVPIPVFEPVAAAPLAPQFVERYRIAYRMLKAKDHEALSLFEALERDYPGDHMVRLYIDRLRDHHEGVVIVMTEK
jgi:adenylate cyclase